MADQRFPELQNDRILVVAGGGVPDKIPVWIMRQAGRYLPEFRELRQNHSFFEICRTPELACEATLMPIRRFNLDAAIIFSDILVIPQALGVEVEMVPGVGPVIPNPISLETIREFESDGVIDRLRYVGEAITMTRMALKGAVPLFGFSGAPWTLMCYMVEGGGSKTMSKAKKWLYTNPDDCVWFLNFLTNIVVDYLVMQVEAGAQILQVFESNAEYLNRELFEAFSLPFLIRITREVRQKLKAKKIPIVPMVLFAKGAHYAMRQLALAEYEVLSVDWTMEPGFVMKETDHNVVIQGNLDPCALYAPKEELQRMVRRMMDLFGPKRYIVNLGHGIYPDMDPQAVADLVEVVHSYHIPRRYRE